MHLSTLRKALATAGGIGVLIAVIAQGMVTGAPAMDKSPAEIQAWYVDHRTLALVAVYLVAFGLTLHLTLIAVLRDRLRGAEGGAATLSGDNLPRHDPLDGRGDDRPREPRPAGVSSIGNIR